MKVRILFIGFMLLFSTQQFGQICSSNPGGDQSICFGEQMTLQGESSTLYLQPLEATWTASASNPAPTAIADPNALVTDVNSTTGADLPLGDYEFTLCVVCVDHELSCQPVVITVGDIINSPAIDAHDDVTCGGNLTLTGSTPDAGVTAYWVINPAFNGTFVDNGTSLELNHFGRAPCSYDVRYVQTIGNCIETDVTEISFIEDYPVVTAFVSNPDSCPSCSEDITLQGTFVGCGGTAIWSVASTPTGVDPSSVNINAPNSWITNVNLPANGEYCFNYTIDNGACVTDEAQVCCEIDAQPGFGLTGNERYTYCQDEWDIKQLFLDEPFLDGAIYEWSLSSTSIPNPGIEIESPNAHETNIIFNNVPYQIGPDGWYFTIVVTMMYGNCFDAKTYTFAINPSINIDAENLNYLCGGDPQFRIIDNVSSNVAGGYYTASVISSPTLPIGNVSPYAMLDLTAEGTHCFEITYVVTGIDPNTGQGTTCETTGSYCVFIADVPTIDCGAAIVTCLLSTQLNGNMPVDNFGNPLDIPVYWEQIGGPTATLINPNSEDPFVTGLTYGETYTFRYVISDTDDCDISCENTITILPENECDPCEVTAEVGDCDDGCTRVQLSGADTYMWTPNTGVDDTDPSNPIICNEAGGEYQVFGFVNGEICGSTIVTLEPCKNTTPECDFSLVRACTTCGCGAPYGGGKLLDSNGNFFHPNDLGVTVEWFIDGNSWGTGSNPFYLPYDEPYALCASISFEENDGSLCELYLCVDVTCHGDCPQVSFATCADAPFNELPECNGYDPAYACSFSGYTGYVWALDLAGNVISDYNWTVDWYDDNWVDPNPIYLYPGWGSEACEGVPYSIFDWNGDCGEVQYFDGNCCNQAAPTITCAGKGEGGWQIGYTSWCPNTSYQFTVSCGNGYYEVFDVEPQGTGELTWTVPYYLLEECSWLSISMAAVCEDGDISPQSNCVWLFAGQEQCIEIQEGCDYWWSGEGDGKGDGKEGRYSADANNGQGMLYPNPTNDGNFILQLSPTHLTKANLNLNLYTTAGQLVYSSSLAAGQRTHEITADLNSGMYLVSIEDAAGAVIDSERLVVSK